MKVVSVVFGVFFGSLGLAITILSTVVALANYGELGMPEFALWGLMVVGGICLALVAIFGSIDSYKDCQ